MWRSDGTQAGTFPVTGGNHYHFAAAYRADGVAVPRRSVIVKLNWRDAAGHPVALDEPAVQGILSRMKAMAETDTRLRRPDLWERHEGARIQSPSGARRQKRSDEP